MGEEKPVIWTFFHAVRHAVALATTDIVIVKEPEEAIMWLKRSNEWWELEE